MIMLITKFKMLMMSKSDLFLPNLCCSIKNKLAKKSKQKPFFFFFFMFQKQNSKFLLFLFIQCITTNKLYICVCIGMGISLSLRIEPFSFLNESYMTSRCHQSENLFSFFYMYSFNSFRMTRTHSYFFSIHSSYI